jgi:hypothetical protein
MGKHLSNRRRYLTKDELEKLTKRVGRAVTVGGTPR